MNQSELLSLENRCDEFEAAKYLRRKVSTLRNWRVTGDGPRYLKIGGRVEYLRSDLEEFVFAGLVNSTTEAERPRRRPRRETVED